MLLSDSFRKHSPVFSRHCKYLFSNLCWFNSNVAGAGLCKVPASQVEEKELKAYRKIEKEEMNTLLNQYLNFCRVSLKVSWLIQERLHGFWNHIHLRFLVICHLYEIKSSKFTDASWNAGDREEQSCKWDCWAHWSESHYKACYGNIFLLSVCADAYSNFVMRFHEKIHCNYFQLHCFHRAQHHELCN